MSTVFISDLHLSLQETKTSEIFIKFLQENHHTIETLYILGDFFNYWIGDDLQLKSFENIINALHKFNSPKSRTLIMYGNRDFLYGESFFNKTNSKYIPDPYFITLDNKKIMLTHGDLMFDRTFTYQLYRRTCLFFNKSNLIRNTFFKCSRSFRERIAKKLRSHSQSYSHHKQFEVDGNGFLKTLYKNKVDILIHGHTHIPCIQLLLKDDLLIERYTMSDWHDFGNALTYKQHKWQLTYFN